MRLTVQITSQQLQADGGLLRVAEWMDPDVASHKRRRECVLFHPGAVHVAVKDLQEIHNRDLKNCAGKLDAF